MELTLVKEVPNMKLYKDKNGNRHFRLEGVRLSYPFFGTPGKNENDNGEEQLKYSCKAMLPKETHQEAYDLLQQVCQKMQSENEVKIRREHLFISDGDDGEKEEMHGHWVVSISSYRRPRVRNRRGQVMDDIAAIDDMFYGGCWAHLLFSPWYFNGKSKKSTKTYPKRICGDLESAFFMKDDEAFGNGRIDDRDAWEGVVEDDGGDGMGDDDL